MSIFAIDLGFSNVKLAVGGNTDVESTYLMPAGVVPAGDRAQGITDKAATSGLSVLVDGEMYVAGIDHHETGRHPRILDADYPASVDYRALYYAGLATLNSDHVKTVVTGLPSYQAVDKKRVDALKNMLVGEHQVAKKRVITVDNAIVVAQPTGAYMDYYASAEDPEGVENSNVLIVDPGFFSVDWVLVSHGAIMEKSRESSKAAVSVILEDAVKLLGEDFGIKPRPIDLEKAIRGESTTIWLAGRKVDITDYLNQARHQSAEAVSRLIKMTLRENDCAPDIIVMAGGGAAYYADAIQAEFPNSLFVQPEAPVFANVRGYFLIGESAENNA